MKRAVILISLLFVGLSATEPPKLEKRVKKVKIIKIKRHRRGGSVFLINRAVPHYYYTIRRLWDSKELNLKRNQKRELFSLARDRKIALKRLKREIRRLERAVRVAFKAGKSPEELNPLVDRVAMLKAAATKMDIETSYKVRKILTPEQLEFIESKRFKKRRRHRGARKIKR